MKTAALGTAAEDVPSCQLISHGSLCHTSAAVLEDHRSGFLLGACPCGLQEGCRSLRDRGATAAEGICRHSRYQRRRAAHCQDTWKLVGTVQAWSLHYLERPFPDILKRCSLEVHKFSSTQFTLLGSFDEDKARGTSRCSCDNSHQHSCLDMLENVRSRQAKQLLFKGFLADSTRTVN